jgi:hypothetical protein
VIPADTSLRFNEVAKLSERGRRRLAGLARQFVLTCNDANPDLIIHLAVVVVGIGANRANQGRYFYDCVRCILLATEKYDKSEPINLGAGFEISIKDLAEKIAALTGFKGSLEWDASQPDSHPRRPRAEREFSFRARIGFDEGLKQTIEWYRNQMSVDESVAITPPNR